MREALLQQREQREWLRSLSWGENTTGLSEPAENIEATLVHHGRIIAMYEALIADLEERGAEAA